MTYIMLLEYEHQPVQAASHVLVGNIKSKDCALPKSESICIVAVHVEADSSHAAGPGTAPTALSALL